MQANVEADPLFQLLTDALRAGPGSAQWSEAVGELRTRGGEESDEYQLLVTARERLESGKEYRTVRAGPGFTRKLFENIENDESGGDRKRTLPTATIIALFSALGIVLVLAVLGWQLTRGTPQPTGSVSITELENAFFPNEVSSAAFDSAIPPNWQMYGQLPLEVKAGGLHPVLGNTASKLAVGGAVVAPDALPPGEPFAAEARLKLNKPTDDVIVEVFVSGGTDFSPATAASSHELVWLLRGNRQQVVLGEARREADAARPEPGKGATGGKPADGDLTVRILFNRDAAIVECNGQRLWAGAHGLPADAPRHVGVRFLRTAGSNKTAIPATVQSVQVLKR